MHKSRQRTNRTNIIAVVSLAASLFHSPLHQQANAQQFLSTDEISAIRERAIAGQATQADKQRLYNSLPREDWRRLINLQALSGAIQGAKDYQSLLNTAVRLNGYGDQKVIATVGAIVEAEKVPGDDSYKQGLKYFDDKQTLLSENSITQLVAEIQIRILFGGRRGSKNKTTTKQLPILLKRSKPNREIISST